MIVGYLQTKPENLHAMPDDDSAAGQAWPSQRSWTMAADMVAAHLASDGTTSERATLLLGAVGAAGYEAANYIEHQDLPNPEDILNDPIETFTLPERSDQKFVVLHGVGAAVIRNMTDERWLKAWDVMVAAADNGAVDIAVVSAKNMCTEYSRLIKEEGRKLPIPRTQLPTFTEILTEAGILGGRA